MLSSIFSPPIKSFFDFCEFGGSVQIRKVLFPVLLFLFSFPLFASSSGVLPGDSSLVAHICADEFYVFNGDTLNQPGTYAATYTASDGSDSTVTLLLSVFPLYSDSVYA
ncbi:MAG: hypothetical protein RL013_1469, partial [Bacteroidota bacterium]